MIEKVQLHEITILSITYHTRLAISVVLISESNPGLLIHLAGEVPVTRMIRKDNN
jgi:hypothetical protein